MKDTQYDIIIETPDGTTIKRTMGFASMIDAMDFVEKKWPGRLSLKITKTQKTQNNFTNGPKKNYNKFVNKKNKKNIYTPGGANERRNRPTHN